MIDQGGTFTDVIAINPNQEIVSLKVLSNTRDLNESSVFVGIDKLIKDNQELANYPINSIKIGTTIATNALLERKGEKVLLCVTKGFKDNFVIGDQKRKDLFARHFTRKPNLYKDVIEIDERISKDGHILKKINKEKTRNSLKRFVKKGIKSISIVLINSFKFPVHEKTISSIAKEVGFEFISCSYLITPTINYTTRGFTTLVDAYLNPLIKSYVKKISKNIKANEIAFMQSNGFLCEKNDFNGKNAIYSGPAGGVNAGIKIAKDNKIKKIIGFDMGGTSSDIWHYHNNIEKKLETKVSDITIKTPTLKIDSIAAGGGSIIKYEHQRLVVGPESAGSFPGPACYRNDGPLTLTDCNLILGKISPINFPKYFGKNKNSIILKSHSEKKFKIILKKIKKEFSEYNDIYEIADAFIKVAVENMVSSIKKISIQKGHDIRKHSLLIFGSASGQYCCQVADKLGINNILFHPLSSLLSAFGAGISDHGSIQQTSIEKNLNALNLKKSIEIIKKKITKKKYLKQKFILRLKYKGSNTLIQLRLKKTDIKSIKKLFISEHKKQFGFSFLNRKILIDSIEIEAIKENKSRISSKNIIFPRDAKIKKNFSSLYYNNRWIKVKNINFSSFQKNNKINGPLLFNDFNTSILVEKEWTIELLSSGVLQIKKKNKIKSIKVLRTSKGPNPELLEVFNNLFFSTAEQMGEVLKNTAQSVNVKERLDFSCALFDKKGNLIANAPHIPIHLGAMSETVKFCIQNYQNYFHAGTSLIHNDPYTGGTHLPDLTIITPYLDKIKNKVLFYFANRAHHSDVGGISPGSMPAFSKNIYEEGIIFKGFPILKKGTIMEKEVLKKLKKNKYPSRDAALNLSDIKAQVASTTKGITEMDRIINTYGIKNVLKYVKFIQENCTKIVRKTIRKLPKTKFKVFMDNKAELNLLMFFDKKTKNLIIDFKGSSEALPNNFNTPTAVTKSVVIYFLRTLIKENIPLNEGFLEEVKIKIPDNSMLKPKSPAPVVAGNVETSQSIIDLLNGSVKVQAACYGTMSNLTFGDGKFGYYETICGGEGASPDQKGNDAVHCHMTNTSITDAEILEWNYPVRLKSFSIRKKSGGIGKYNGGNGTIRELYFLKKLTITILSNRRIVAPFGLNGGNSGKVGKNFIKRRNGTIKKLNHACSLKVNAGDIIRIETPGGGGFGIVK